MRPVFLYGTLLEPRVLARVGGDRRLARRLVRASLAGHLRVAFRGTPYPTLLPGEGVVVGALLRPAPAVLQRLVAYEGPAYRLVPVAVQTARGRRRARAWCARRWLADAGAPWPPGGHAGARLRARSIAA